MNQEHTYNKIETSDLTEELEMFRLQIQKFFQFFRYPTDLKYDLSLHDLIDMIVRTDKRRSYYLYFHEMDINETKAAALYAYWVLKFQPIAITDIRYKGSKLSECINETFAIFIIYSTLRRIFAQNPNVKNIPFDPTDDKSYCGKLMYSFRYRNISLDAMILLVESIDIETLFKEYEANK